RIRFISPGAECPKSRNPLNHQSEIHCQQTDIHFHPHSMPLSTFSQNSVKGRVAETIIQELFLAHDFNVFHYGMERSIPGIAQLTRKTVGAVKQQIRSMPDFVVQDPRNNKLHFVEVKYRASGTFTLEDIKGEYPWPQAFFIVVTKEH